MGLITRTYSYSAGAVIVAANHNTNENTVYNEINGNLSNANLASNAAIVDTKLASITTAGKVNISALTVASQATGDMIYASSASAWARLAIGSATTVLHGGTTPAFSALVTADLPSGTVLQYVTAKSGAVASGTGTYTLDDNIPTTSNGNALAALNLTITPKNASNILEFSGVMNLANNTTGVKQMVVALHQDSTANALAVFTHTKGADDDQIVSVPISFTVAAGTTSATTFKLYYGGDGASTTTVNGTATARKWGGVLYSSFTVKELKA